MTGTIKRIKEKNQNETEIVGLCAYFKATYFLSAIPPELQLILIFHVIRKVCKSQVHKCHPPHSTSGQ